ncbi:MAG: hypothetical protein FWD57_14210 [Polyangiaceae bacterium]|nr:hypothetical protein [Polyangiaceae bacterium]
MLLARIDALKGASPPGDRRSRRGYLDQREVGLACHHFSEHGATTELTLEDEVCCGIGVVVFDPTV